MRANAVLCLALGLVLGACGDDDNGVGDVAETVDTSRDLLEVELPPLPETEVSPEVEVAPETEVRAETLLPEPEPEVVEETTPEPQPEVAEETTPEPEPEITEPEPEVAEEVIEETTPEVAEETVEVVPDTTTEVEVVEPGGDPLVDGSFEEWVDGLPVGWMGSASNITSDSVLEDTSEAHDGVRAAQLVNESSTHKRFSSAPAAFPDGRYTCTYWVRGTGEVRNAFYDGEYSSYTSYTSVDQGEWRELSYTFNVDGDSTVELIFSVRNTSVFGLRIDDVDCARQSEACDALQCESWQTCRNDQPACVTANGFCADALDCEAWENCNGEHLCELAAGFCEDAGDCGGATPVCDPGTHVCVAGDLCEGVTCNEWETCNSTNGACDVSPGRCETPADCDQALPTCQLSTHTCVAVDAAANVVPNGGFEAWADYSLGGAATYELPDFWYGLQGDGPYFPETEIDPNDVVRYTTNTHSGNAACQLIEPSQPADRFTTEPFAVTPTATYACSYWVRGHGTYRHRAYCGQWAPDTQYTPIDSDAWQQVTFDMSGSASTCVLAFYASNTVADRDHIQLDDVVCIRK